MRARSRRTAPPRNASGKRPRSAAPSAFLGDLGGDFGRTGVGGALGAALLGLFLLGLTLFFRETLSQWAAGSQNLTSYILFGLVGVNFLIELGVNIVLAPVIVRIVHAAHQMKNQEEI